MSKTTYEPLVPEEILPATRADINRLELLLLEVLNLIHDSKVKRRKIVRLRTKK